MKTQRLINQRGYSLTELMVVIAIIGLTSIGTMSMMGNLLQKNQIVTTKANILAIRDRFENNLRDSEAWRETIYAAANDGILDCLRITTRDNQKCLDNTVIPAGSLTIMTKGLLDVNGCTNGEEERNEANCRDGAVFFDDTVAGNGFSIEGEDCNTYGTPDDSCPIGVDLSLRMDCRNDRPRCKNPELTLTMQFIFTPNTESSVVNTLDSNKYSAQFDLSEGNERHYFEVKFIAVGGGACVDNVATARPINQITALAGNPLVLPLASALRGGADQDIHVRPGIYNCRVTAHISGIEGGARFYLQDRTAGIDYPVGFAQTHVSGDRIAVAKGSAMIDSNVNFRLRLMTLCRAPITPATAANNMGIVVPLAGGANEPFNNAGNYSQAETVSTHTTIKCTRIN